MSLEKRDRPIFIPEDVLMDAYLFIGIWINYFIVKNFCYLQLIEEYFDEWKSL